MDMKKIAFTAALCFLSACAGEKPVLTDHATISDLDLARYKENIVEKRRTQTSVSYEHRDVRIDELTPLATHYCNQKDAQKTAKLREIVMREDHARLATFDCVDLQ